MKQVKADFGATNYLFNAGSKADLVDNDGVFYQDSKVRLPDITDGTSNTLLRSRRSRATATTRRNRGRAAAVRLLKKDALKGIKDDTGVADFKEDQHIAGDRCASWMDGRSSRARSTPGSRSTTSGPT